MSKASKGTVTEAAAISRLCDMPSVSRETLDWLTIYLRELELWQTRINLVAPAALGELWPRHVLDSAQLVELAPHTANRWIDLGSGGGFPGIVIACQLKTIGKGEIHLVESSNKKAAFLRHVATLLNLPVVVHASRIDAAQQILRGTADVVTARALAPLDELLALANPLLKTDGICLFPKGRDVELELTKAANNWQFSSELMPSLTASDARIVRLARLSRRDGRSSHS